MRKVGVLFAIGLALVIGINSAGVVPAVGAKSSDTWVSSPGRKVFEADTQTENLSYACSGVMQHIKVNSWPGVHEACVYGSSGKARFARYTSPTGGFVYGVAFSLDDEFTPVRDMCLQYTFCAYGQAEDVLLVRSQLQNGLGMAMIKDYTKKLYKAYDRGEYYSYSGDNVWKYVSFGDTPAIVNAFAVSKNGKWAVVELVTYGFVRINLHDLSYRRVVAPGASYGYGANPSYELAISDDGATIAITGWRGSIEVYEASDSCGDLLTSNTPISFSPYTYACKRAEIDAYSLFPGFRSGYAPHFSSDGRQLMLDVEYNQGLRRVTVAPSSEMPAQTLSYSAFGDSFTSGEGETDDAFYISPTNTKENKCHVSSRSYPYVAGSFWAIPTVNRACSGARIEGVLSASQKVLNETPAATRPSHISVSIGGNDINLIGKLKTCLAPTSCEWVSPNKRAQGAAEIRGIFNSVVALLQVFKRDYSTAELAVVGYPRVVNTAPGAPCGAIISPLLNSEERRYMDESIKYVNQVLSAAATYAHVPYIDISNAYANARLCDQNPLAMNGVRFGDDIAPLSFLSDFKVFGAESFHPTPKGHDLVAGVLQRYGSNWKVAPDCGCVFTEALLEPDAYWKEGENAESPRSQLQSAGEFISEPEGPPGSTISVHFPALTFKPESTVKLELHSEPLELTALVAQPDGSLTGTITFPSDITGYHTVHAIGASFSEKEVDIYQTVALAEKTGSVPVTETPVSDPPSLNNELSNSGTKTKPAMYTPHPLNNTDTSLAMGVLGFETPLINATTSRNSYQNIEPSQNTRESKESFNWQKWAQIGALGVFIGAILFYVVYALIRHVTSNDRYNERI